MRYSSEHKAETRRHILDIAAAAFRVKGVDGIGIKDVMAEAGLTHGGFYAHFKARDALVEAALVHAFDAYWDDVRIKLGNVAEDDRLEFLFRNYLRVGHRDSPEKACVLATLGSEVARLPAPARAALSHKLGEVTALIAALLPEGGGGPMRDERAAQLYAMLAGTLQMSRIAKDQDALRFTLSAAVQQALALARAPWPEV